MIAPISDRTISQDITSISNSAFGLIGQRGEQHAFRRAYELPGRGLVRICGHVAPPNTLDDRRRAFMPRCLAAVLVFADFSVASTAARKKNREQQQQQPIAQRLQDAPEPQKATRRHCVPPVAEEAVGDCIAVFYDSGSMRLIVDAMPASDRFAVSWLTTI